MKDSEKETGLENSLNVNVLSEYFQFKTVH